MLRAARLARGLTQAALAARIGKSRDTIQYWEAKPEISGSGTGIRIAEALGLGPLVDQYARAGGWGLSTERQVDASLEAQERRHLAAKAQRLARLGVFCGAKTRKGTACRCLCEPGKRRCRFHGGLSTGPKTRAGRIRIADAQRRRWARIKSCSGASAPVECP